MAPFSPNLEVIVLTIHDAPEYREAAYGSQANYIISKGSSTKEEIFAHMISGLMRNAECACR